MKSKVKPGRYPEFKERLNLLALNYKSVTDFADALGLSRQTVGFWLNGDRVPDAESLITTSERMHVSVDWLLGLVGIRNASNDVDEKAISDSLGLSSYAVNRLMMESDHGAYKQGIFDYIICNSNSVDQRSYLYYLHKAEYMINEFEKESWGKAERKISWAKDGMELNRREMIEYCLAKSASLFSEMVEEYYKARWNHTEPQEPRKIPYFKILGDLSDDYIDALTKQQEDQE